MSDEKDEVRSEPEATPEEAPQIPTSEGILNDTRRAIYERSDAIRFAPPPKEEAAEETEPEQPEPQAKPEEEGKEPEAKQEAGAEEPAGEETPREKRKRENLEDKEKRLSAWEQKLVAQFQAAEKPPEDKPAASTDPASVPLRHMTEEQIQGRYDELALESPYKANRFMQQVERAKDEFARETDERRVLIARSDFRSAYPEATDADFVKMHDPAFYEKHQSVMKAIARGDEYAALVSAYEAIEREKLVAKLEYAARKEREREAEIERRNELKKKGAVLRVQTRVVQPPKKDEAPETPEAIKARRIAEMISASRKRQGL